jgi:hypothetical protein
MAFTNHWVNPTWTNVKNQASPLPKAWRQYFVGGLYQGQKQEYYGWLQGLASQLHEYKKVSVRYQTSKADVFKILTQIIGYTTALEGYCKPK